MFFERYFRPLRITKLGDSAGLLTGYYEPIVDGSRFPTGIFKVPIYRRTGAHFRAATLARQSQGRPLESFEL
jgi:hypothetical protein